MAYATKPAADAQAKQPSSQPTEQTWWQWMTGQEPVRSPAEIRDERYASYIVALDRLFADFEGEKLSKEKALEAVEEYMVKIRDIGRVDGERARIMLEKKGIDDQRRMDLEREYQDLKRQNGQTVPEFGAKEGSKEGSKADQYKQKDVEREKSASSFFFCQG
eukprot:TRINITY_DN69050_c0_g1_i1.p1 TRINITY_DN69050_c0_g1~~TRINITY_DN69050_c0_g1_i1.p1  ORF type:complete len:181 (+),score=45.19 TRINITY_DN69050_c0_g1_i1:58-543(+)